MRLELFHVERYGSHVMAEPTQKAPLDPLVDAEVLLEKAMEAARRMSMVSGAHVAQLAQAAALVSVAKTLRDLSEKLSLCGHGYLGAICHLCMRPLG